MIRTLAALVVSTVLLAGGCGGDDDAGSSPAPAAERQGPTAEGTGYTVELPEGFRDMKDRFEGSAIRVDLAYADPTTPGFATNVNVIREEPPGEFDLDSVMESFEAQANLLATDAGISAIEDRELDGVPAKSYSYVLRKSENPRVRQRQVIVVEGDAVYTITWSVAAQEFEAQEPVLDRILASWRWS